MVKKAKLYLLVLVNLMVWGYVGYKIYGALQGDDELNFEMTQTKLKSIDKQVDAEIEKLDLNYDDPFLKQGHFSESKSTHYSANQNQSNQNTQPQQKPVLIAKTTPTISAIDIKYLGLVQSSTSSNLTALLMVNGKSVLVKQNDVVEGYSIRSISNESIIAIKGKEKLIIGK